MDFLDIESVLENIELKESMLAAEFGCGSAHFTISLAKKLKKGRIYAFDIQPEKLSALEGKIKHEHLSNVKIILSDLEKPNGSTLKDNSIDIVVIPNLLFQAQDKYSIIKEAYRILKTGGQILIIDWQKNSILNLKNEIFDANQAKQMAQEIGFEPKKEFMASDHHYGLLFIKK